MDCCIFQSFSGLDAPIPMASFFLVVDFCWLLLCMCTSPLVSAVWTASCVDVGMLRAMPVVDERSYTSRQFLLAKQRKLWSWDTQNIALLAVFSFHLKHRKHSMLFIFIIGGTCLTKLATFSDESQGKIFFLIRLNLLSMSIYKTLS